MTASQFLRRHVVRIVIGVVLVAVAYFAISIYSTYQHEQRIAQGIDARGGEVDFQYVGPLWIPESLHERLFFFSRIQRVSLSSVISIPSELYSELESLTFLDDLDLEGTQTSDAECLKLTGMANLRILRLGRTQITDVGMMSLKGLVKLYWLELTNTQVTDNGLKTLQGQSNLEILDLRETQITDAGLENLRAMKGLAVFGVPTQITDVGLEHLKGLTKLRGLNLSETQTTSKGRASLRKALPNCNIEPDP